MGKIKGKAQTLQDTLHPFSINSDLETILFTLVLTVCFLRLSQYLKPDRNEKNVPHVVSQVAKIFFFFKVSKHTL